MITKIAGVLAVFASASIAGPLAAQEKPQAGQKAPTVGERLSTAVQSIAGNPMAQADTDMKRVLNALANLNPAPIETLSAQEARKQPTPADGVKAVLRNEGKPDAPLPGVTAQDIKVTGAAGELPARVYKPDGVTGPLPVILYFHGGGFVIADLDTYDATPRSMAKLANSVVISSHYRQAPEHKFPAAQEDSIAVYKWVLQNAAAQGGDPQRVSVMGESAGGNLAINVAVAARDQKLQMPVHQALIYPLVGINTATPSYAANADAKPLNKAMMEWFFEQVVAKPEDKASPMLDVVGKAQLNNLPATTIITAEIDPLRSEGQMLAEKMKSAGVNVEARDYAGSTHEFFGMAAVVKDAAEAQAFVAQRLTEASSKRTAN